MRFPTTRLGTVSDFIRGVSFKPDDVQPLGTENTIACFRTKNVQAEIDLNDVWAVPCSAVNRGEQILQEGDLLISSANSWNLVGKCCWVPRLDWPATLGGFISALRPKRAEVFPRFLYHWFSFAPVQAKLRGCARQTTNISNLDLNQALDLRIPLPPMEEQRRIAAILDKADALRQKRRIALQTLDSLTQSIFLDMFGDQARSRGEWPTVSFRNIATFTTGKLDSNASVVGGTYPFFTCSRDDFFIDVYAFDCEALLLAGNNAAGEYSVKHYNGKFNAYQRTYVIQVDPSICTFQYMRLALSAKLSELKHLSKGTGTRYLTLEILHRLQFSLPPYSLQKDFGFKLSRLQDQRSRLERGISHFGDLFTSLQHRAFRGEL